VYVLVVVLFNTGDQEPTILLFEVPGSGLNTSPLHIGAIVLKVGVAKGLTTIVIVVGLAHCPLIGVNVYVVVVVLFKAGDQVPVIPLFDVFDRGFKISPAQIAVVELNVGIVAGFTVMVIEELFAH
jgi:hypothetical protein